MRSESHDLIDISLFFFQKFGKNGLSWNTNRPKYQNDVAIEKIYADVTEKSKPWFFNVSNQIESGLFCAKLCKVAGSHQTQAITSHLKLPNHQA